MFKKNLHYIRGYLRIRISGNSVERFVNLCANKNIYLWDLVVNQKSYTANIRLNDFKKIKPIVRKTKTKVVITERIGFPFIIGKYRYRKLFFAGFFLCILMIFYLSTMIWDISLQGNLSYSDENILKYLNGKEIRPGKYKSEIDCFKLAGDIRKEYDNIIWVSVSIDGSKLIINIKENNDSSVSTQKIKTHSTSGYDIVSNIDCKIISIVTRAGIPVVKPGDMVKKGDILISGQIPVYNDQKEIIHYKRCTADGDISGQISINYEDELLYNYAYKNSLDAYKHEYFFRFGKWCFSLGGIKNNYKDFQMYTKTIKLGNMSFGKRSVFPYTLTKKTYTSDEIQKILSSNYNYYCDELQKKGVVILQNNVKIYTWSDRAKASGTLLVNTPVGLKKLSREIEVGDSIDGNDGNNN